jgi:hypothetical protein
VKVATNVGIELGGQAYWKGGLRGGHVLVLLRFEWLVVLRTCDQAERGTQGPPLMTGWPPMPAAVRRRGLPPAASATGDLGFDQAGRLAAAGVTAAFDERRATRTMAALTAMIDRRPTHCSASPVPSPQYGLEGPTSNGMT